MTEEQRDYLDQIIRIAATMDRHGYQSASFLDDLLFDGDKQQFLYIDAGSDLSKTLNGNSKKCFDMIVRGFPMQVGYVTEQYSRFLLD